MEKIIFFFRSDFNNVIFQKATTSGGFFGWLPGRGYAIMGKSATVLPAHFMEFHFEV
jgi:hypothetical protein